MPIAMVSLTLDLYDGQGNPIKSGNAVLTPSAQLRDIVDHELITQAPVTVQFAATGLPVVTLLPTDNSNVQPGGWVWQITFNGVAGNPPGFNFALPLANGATQFLSAQAPMGSTGTFSEFLQGQYPEDATKYLDGTGNWTVPAGSSGGAVSSVNGQTGVVTLTPGSVGALSASLNLADVPDKAAALTNLGVAYPVTTVNGFTGDVELAAADLGAIPAGSVGTLQLRATTPATGFALQNGTPTIVSYAIPDDGNIHRFLCTTTRVTTANLTGGVTSLVGTAPDGTAASVQIQAAGQSVGVTGNEQQLVAKGGTTISAQQTTAITAGAGKVWIDLWEMTPGSLVTPPVQNQLLMGTDSGSFTAMQSVIPQERVSRQYYGSSAGVPSSWPAGPAGCTRRVVSFRPDIPSLLNGSLDTAIKAWMAKAPDGDWLTTYHEANLSTNEFRLNGWTASQFVAAQQKLKALALIANPGLLIGQILSASSTAQADSPWVATGLDWYGIDGYAGTSNKTASTVFSTSIQNVLNVVPDALLAITETNAGQGTNAQWNQWFRDVFSIAQAHNMAMVLTWWGATPTDHPPSFSTTGPYVSTLQSIAASL